MLMTLIQKEIMHHILSARFVALLLMCVLLIPLNLHINYHHYLKRQIDYQEQETLKDENALKDENGKESTGMSFQFRAKATDTSFEVSKLILKTDTFKCVCDGFRSRTSELPWYDPQRHHAGRSVTIYRADRLSFRASRLRVCRQYCSLAYWHYCLRLMPLQAKEKQEHFG